MLIKSLILSLLLFFCFFGFAQEKNNYFQKHSSNVYNVKQLKTGIIVAGAFGLNYIGFSNLRGLSALTREELDALDTNSVNRLDRKVFQFDGKDAVHSQKISDGVLTSSLILPIILALDNEIRNDWIDISLLYLETGIIASNLYSWGGPRFKKRIRPLAYYESLDIETRRNGNNRLSFYSGHVLSTAASTFFIAKVYSDYHPEIGNKKYFLYGLALLPPTYLGYHRLKALKHYPTDVIIGFALGATTGIIIPELHKNKNNTIQYSIESSTDSYRLKVIKSLSVKKQKTPSILLN